MRSIHFFPKKTMRNIRKRYRLKKLIEIHHVIPREFSKHPVLKKYNFDTEESYNLMFCASTKGISTMNLRETRPVHSGGHMSYNKFTIEQLDRCNSIFDLYVLWLCLHLGCRGLFKIPWK